ncbi:recombinase family protein [bacterium]|nr:recombinase family protein [bacterium]
MMHSMPRRAAIYARVSTSRQRKEATIDSQLTELRTRVERDGHQLLPEHIVVDDGQSGSYLERPGLDRLRDLARERAIDLVYVLSPDRLARKYAYQVLLIEELERFSCQLVFLGQASGDDPESHLLVQIQGVIAEYERAKICERSRRGKLHQARKGVVLSWKAPYGYRYVPRKGMQRGRWEINEAESPMIKMLFGWVQDEAISIRQATKRLNASAYRPRGGREQWSPSSVRAILTNEAYIGNAYYNRRRWIESDRTDQLFRKGRKTRSVERPRQEWIRIPIPALIEEETFARVQQQLQKNSAFSRRNLQRGEEYLLRCLVKCGVCGRSMVANSYGRHTYYRCAASTDHISTGRARKCPTPSVFAPDLDQLVWKEISTLLRSPTLVEQAWQKQQGTGLGNHDAAEAELNRLEEQIRDARSQLRRLVDAYQRGWIHSDELTSRRPPLERQIVLWTAERDRLEAKKPQWREMQAISTDRNRFLEHIGTGLAKLDFNGKQKLLRKVIERVEVTAWDVRVKLAIPLSTNFDLTTVGAVLSQAPALVSAPPSRDALSPAAGLPAGSRDGPSSGQPRRAARSPLRGRGLRSPFRCFTQ